MYNGREPQSAFSRFLFCSFITYPSTAHLYFTRIFFVMSVQDSQNCEQVSAMKLVSIAERKQFRICKMQKCKKVLNQFFKLTKKTHSTYFAAKNEYGKPKIGAALPQHSPSAMGRQKKWPPITAAIYPCIKLQLQYRVMTRFSGQPSKAYLSTLQPLGMDMLVRLEQP